MKTDDIVLYVVTLEACLVISDGNFNYTISISLFRNGSRVKCSYISELVQRLCKHIIFPS